MIVSIQKKKITKDALVIIKVLGSGVARHEEILSYPFLLLFVQQVLGAFVIEGGAWVAGVHGADRWHMSDEAKSSTPA